MPCLSIKTITNFLSCLYRFDGSDIFSTGSKLIILVIVAETKFLHVVNLLVFYGENIEEK